MIAKKTDKGNLENKRGLFLLVGFAVVLGLIYAGFELFANEDKAPGLDLPDDEFITVVDDDVIATDQTPPPPPEPQQQQQEVVLNIVEDNIKVNTDLSFDVEFNEDEAIVEVGDDDVVLVEDVAEEEPPMMFNSTSWNRCSLFSVISRISIFRDCINLFLRLFNFFVQFIELICQ